MTFQAAQDAGVVGITSTGAGIDHDVDVGQLMLMLAKGFSDQAFDPIAPNSAAHHSGSRGQSEARRMVAAVADEDGEHCIAQATRIAIDAIEVRFGVKPLSRSECAGERGQINASYVALLQRATRSLRQSGACGPWRGVVQAPGDL